MNCPVNSDEFVEFESTRLSQATKSGWLDSVSSSRLLDAEMGGQDQNWLDSINGGNWRHWCLLSKNYNRGELGAGAGPNQQCKTYEPS